MTHGLLSESQKGLASLPEISAPTTERLHFHFSLSCTGEGNGDPLQCSCLENPRDGGAWWAAVYGVAQSRTRLKRLSSSSRPSAAPELTNQSQTRKDQTIPKDLNCFLEQNSSLCVYIYSLSCVQLFVTPWAIQSMEFSRPEYWSGSLFPFPGDLPNSGIEPRSPALQAESYQLSYQGKPQECVIVGKQNV